MKKLIALSLALVTLLAALTACGSKPAAGGVADVDLEAFYQTIFTEPENTPAMGPMDAEMLEAFYPGLSALSLKQTVAYMPMITAVPCEIVMVECENAADVDAVKDIFEARIASVVGDRMNYPAVIEAWEKEATVIAGGNYAAMFVVNGMTEQVVNNFVTALAG